MECDYTRLNHISLASHKKVITKGMIINGVYCTTIEDLFKQEVNRTQHQVDRT